jgi:hypothetical protein
MADITYGQWGTVTFQVPEALLSIQDNVNTAAEFLVAVLDIALTALEFVKTFLVGSLDPIAAVVEAIIAEVEALVVDMRALGIFITGDWKLLEWPYPELKGGFEEYQRRMISRLTDLTDPSRPDVSPATKVLSMFFYLSADVSEVQQVVSFVRQMLSFFDQSISPQGSKPIPVPCEVQYGSDAIDIMHPKSIPQAFQNSPTPPSLAKIRWNMASTSQRSPFNPIPPIPPAGFIVTVSTVKDGLKVMFDAPQSDTSLQPSATDTKVTVQPREYGQVIVKDSSAPLILFGGADMTMGFGLTDGLAYNTSLNAGGQVKEGFSRVYMQKVTGDDAIIPLEELMHVESTNQTDGSMKLVKQRLMQRTFYVPMSEVGASWAAGEFGFVLAAEDMPYTCTWEKSTDTGTLGHILPKNIELATNAYVRVAACSSAVMTEPNNAQYIFLSPNARGGRPYIASTLAFLAADDLGAWSRPVQVTFPGSNTQVYLDALKVALLVLVLSRPDLKLYDPSAYSTEVQAGIRDGKILRPHEVFANCGLEKMAHLADMVMEDYQTSIQSKGWSPGKFREVLVDSIERVANAIYNTTGQNDRVEKIVAG